MKSAAKSVNEFLGHLLSTLSGAAWMPAFVVVSGSAFVINFYSWRSSEVESAGPFASALATLLTDSLAKYALGLVMVLVVALFVESFSYASIRALEGYWSTRRRPVRAWTVIRTNRLANRRLRLEDERRELIGRLVDSFAKKAPSYGLVEAEWSSRCAELKAILVGRGNIPEDLSDEDLEEGSALEVEVVAADPALSRQLESVERRLERFPEPDRVLPTTLGNCLRAHEDRASEILGNPMEKTIHRRHDELPPSMREEKDLLSESLRLHSAVSFACALVTLVVLAMMIGARDASGFNDTLGFWALPVLFFALAWVSYFGALAAADDYGDMLEKAAETLAEADEEALDATERLQESATLEASTPTQLQLLAL